MARHRKTLLFCLLFNWFNYQAISQKECLDKRLNYCKKASNKHPDKFLSLCKKDGSKIKTQFCCKTCHELIKPQTPFLYRFDSFKFTNCEQTGRFGPTLEQCRSSYSDSWINNSSFFNIATQGIQEWTVPETAKYRIEVMGAQGGNVPKSKKYGGKGASMRGDFNLTKGDKLKILVGQYGTSYQSRASGGGGGSFVATSNNEPLIMQKYVKL